MQYLIAHKVRGELAFDVAEQMQVGDETWWIIPTSGHRAYPFWHTVLQHIEVSQDMRPQLLEHAVPPMPEGLRDHYTVAEAHRHPSVKPQKLDLGDLDLTELGI